MESLRYIEWNLLFSHLDEPIGQIIRVTTEVEIDVIIEKLGRPIKGTIYNENGVLFESVPGVQTVFNVETSTGRHRIGLTEVQFDESTYVTLNLFPDPVSDNCADLKAMTLGEFELKYSDEYPKTKHYFN